jgi:uncharacterized protein YgiM (DUF1202 family)
MASEPVQNPPSLSKRLIKQWRWVGAGLAVIILAVLSKSADVDLSRVGQSDRCQVEVNADVLNVRAGPSTDTPTVKKLSRGDIVDALPETNNGFRRLAADGWVSAQFVTANQHC